jgi:hypothetical protein
MRISAHTSNKLFQLGEISLSRVNFFQLKDALRNPLRPIVRGAPITTDDGRKHTKDEPENPHGNLSRSGLSRQNSKISGSQTQINLNAHGRVMEFTAM